MPFIQLCDKSKHEFVDEYGELKPFVPDVTVIALALSHINRFTGHVGSYSVAQHSIHVYEQVAKIIPSDYRVQLAALLHDATEAYLNDIAKPLKVLLPDYQRIESFYTDIIDQHYGIDTGHDFIKMIDTKILLTEAKSFDLDLVREDIPHLDPYDFEIVINKEPEQVYLAFLGIFDSLMSKIKNESYRSSK